MRVKLPVSIKVASITSRGAAVGIILMPKEYNLSKHPMSNKTLYEQGKKSYKILISPKPDSFLLRSNKKGCLKLIFLLPGVLIPENNRVTVQCIPH